MSYLSYIEDFKLFDIVTKFVADYKRIELKAEKKFEKSNLDPFSAILYASCSGCTLKDWLDSEFDRQILKSFQNKVGELHQNILGSCRGCEVVDNIIDTKCDRSKIIAEIKNKYNTTKGSDKKSLYDNIATCLKNLNIKDILDIMLQ